MLRTAQTVALAAPWVWLGTVLAISFIETPLKFRAPVHARLAHVEAEVARLTQARNFLQSATGCQAEHPALECPHVNAMIDKRLEQPHRAGP